MAGLAFEKNAAWKKLQKREQQIAAKKSGGDAAAAEDALVEISDYDVELQSIGFSELFHYTFNYIGVLTGKLQLKIR